MKLQFKTLILCICLALFTSCNTSSKHENDSLKILSYNIYLGMQQDTTINKQMFAEWIKAQSPDILAIQEANKFTQKSLEHFAKSYSHPYAILIKGYGYPVAITSRYPITDVKRVLDNMTHGFLQVRIQDYNIIVTHLHPNSYIEREKELSLILATIKNTKLDEQWLVMGDFNSISPDDRKHYEETPQYLEQMKQLAIDRPLSINLKDGELYYGVVQKVIDFGLIDALKEKNVEYISTCPTRIEYDQISQDASARYDYIFLSKNIKKRIKSVEVIKDDFTHFHSDHYPTCLELFY